MISSGAPRLDGVESGHFASAEDVEVGELPSTTESFLASDSKFSSMVPSAMYAMPVAPHLCCTLAEGRDGT